MSERSDSKVAFDRDPALSYEALREIAEAAREFIATTTVFQQRRVSRDAFTRLAAAVYWPSDPRVRP